MRFCGNSHNSWDFRNQFTEIFKVFWWNFGKIDTKFWRNLREIEKKIWTDFRKIMETLLGKTEVVLNWGWGYYEKIFENFDVKRL